MLRWAKEQPVCPLCKGACSSYEIASTGGAVEVRQISCPVSPPRARTPPSVHSAHFADLLRLLFIVCMFVCIATAEEDLACLDHAYFLEEVERLIQSAERQQQRLMVARHVDEQYILFLLAYCCKSC